MRMANGASEQLYGSPCMMYPYGSVIAWQANQYLSYLAACASAQLTASRLSRVSSSTPSAGCPSPAIYARPVSQPCGRLVSPSGPQAEQHAPRPRRQQRLPHWRRYQPRRAQRHPPRRRHPRCAHLVGREALQTCSLYTNGEPCPMCASAVRWSGFRELIYGTSIETLVEYGAGQILISSQEVFEKSFALGGATSLIPGILSESASRLSVCPAAEC